MRYRTSVRACFVLAAFTIFSSCAEDDRRPRRDASVDTGSADTAADALTDVASDCSCGVGEGCLVFNVSRAADDSELPWIAFAGSDADGVGTLIVGAADADDFSELARQERPDQDLTSAGWTVRVDLGCIPAGPVEARAFLDDNLNTTGGVSSADFVDACLDGRSVDVMINSGVTTEANGVITRTCD